MGQTTVLILKSIFCCHCFDLFTSHFSYLTCLLQQALFYAANEKMGHITVLCWHLANRIGEKIATTKNIGR
jgi:hypothetical protein